MAHRRSAIKKIRIDKKRREQNIRTVSDLRTSIKKLETLILAKKGTEARKFQGDAFSKIDKAVKKGVIHFNMASRKKSRLAARINSIKP